MILLRIRKGKTCESFKAAGRSFAGSRCLGPRGSRKIDQKQGVFGVVLSWRIRSWWLSRRDGLEVVWLDIYEIGTKMFGLKQ